MKERRTEGQNSYAIHCGKRKRLSDLLIPYEDERQVQNKNEYAQFNMRQGREHDGNASYAPINDLIRHQK